MITINLPLLFYVLLYCFRPGSKVYDKAIISLFPENYIPDDISDDSDGYKINYVDNYLLLFTYYIF